MYHRCDCKKDPYYCPRCDEEIEKIPLGFSPFGKWVPAYFQHRCLKWNLLIHALESIIRAFGPDISLRKLIKTSKGLLIHRLKLPIFIPFCFLAIISYYVLSPLGTCLGFYLGLDKLLGIPWLIGMHSRYVSNHLFINIILSIVMILVPYFVIFTGLAVSEYREELKIEFEKGRI